MKNLLNIIVICLSATMSANAQVSRSGDMSGQAGESWMTPLQSGINAPRYASPIYEPFSNAVPSEQTEVGSGINGTRKDGRVVLRGKEDNTDPGITDDNSSPIGDGILPLLAAALAFGGVIYLRRRKRMTVER